MDVLKVLCEELRYKDWYSTYIPHGVSYYAKALIRYRFGIDMDVLAVEDILREEGLLPAREYGIPEWYRKKYFKGNG